MPQILAAYRLAYLPIPKVACTSIKDMLYEAEHGSKFAPQTRPDGTKYFIHKLFPALPFEELDMAELADLHRIAVVRDPIKRLLSAYRNRVVHHRELSNEAVGTRLSEANLPANPDLATFIRYLRRYAKCVRSIGHHTRPQVDFLGRDPSWISRLYRFSELEILAEDVRRLTNSNVSLPWLQKGGPKIKVEDLNPKQIDKLREYYAEDYAVFGSYF